MIGYENICPENKKGQFEIDYINHVISKISKFEKNSTNLNNLELLKKITNIYQVDDITSEYRSKNVYITTPWSFYRKNLRLYDPEPFENWEKITETNYKIFEYTDDIFIIFIKNTDYVKIFKNNNICTMDISNGYKIYGNLSISADELPGIKSFLKKNILLIKDYLLYDKKMEFEFLRTNLTY